MARSFLGKTKEAVGVLPPMGVKCVIEEIEKGETGENAATPGCLMYTATLRVTEPDRFKGASLRDWFTIGTAQDKRAKREETWRRSEGGPGRLVRMLKRAGVAISDDDEEWMEAAEGAEVCITVLKRTDNNGELRNRVGLYFREEDDDFVGVGEELEAADNGARSGGARSARGAGAARGAAASPRAGKAKPADDDDEDEAPVSARGKVKAKRPAPDDDDEDDKDEEPDEDEETPKARKAAAKVKGAAKKRPADDDDDDED
jgi:hypothetical protein